MKDTLIVVCCVIIAAIVGGLYILFIAKPDTPVGESVQYPFTQKNTLTEPPYDPSLLSGTLLLPSPLPSQLREILLPEHTTEQVPLSFVENQSVLDAAFSADGSRAAYLTQSDTEHLITIQGIENPYIVHSQDPIAGLSWSPDGSSLAYATFLTDTNNEGVIFEGWNIIVIHINEVPVEETEESSYVSYLGSGQNPQFISDTQLLYLHENGLYLKDIPSGRIEHIASSQSAAVVNDPAIALFNIPSISVSTDRRQLAVALPTEEVILIVDITNGIPVGERFLQEATVIDSVGFDPVFSPDGNFIAVYDPFGGIVVYSLENLNGWSVLPNVGDISLNNPIFQWLTQRP